MGDRERYRTLGSYYLGVALNYEKAVETYEALVKQFPADEVAHANLSLAYLYTGDVPRAIEQVREVLENRGITAPLMVVKGDGSLIAAEMESALTRVKRAAQYPAAIEPRAAEMLGRLVGPNLRVLDNELEKLALYVTDQRPITPALGRGDVPAPLRRHLERR